MKSKRIKKKLVLFVILLCYITGCSALPTPLEMGDMIFVRTLALDANPDSNLESDEIILTASTGLRGQGLQQNSEPSITLTGSGTSISAAALDAGVAIDQQIFYGYLDQLLLGEGYCQSGILPALEYFARDVELGLDTEVWAIAGEAGEAIVSGGEDGVTDRLTTLQLENLQGVAGLTRTAGQLLTDILEEGATYLPRLAVAEGSLISAGYTITIEDASAGSLVGEAARGLELLEGDPSGEIMQGSSGLVVELWGADCQFQPVMAGGKLVGAEIICTVTANLIEYDQPPTQEDLDLLSEELANQQESRISLALTQLQELGGDAIGLVRKLGMAQPALWEEIQADWGELFPSLPIWVHVDVSIGRD